MKDDVMWRRPVVLMPHTMVLGVAIFGTEFGRGGSNTGLSSAACDYIRKNYKTLGPETMAMDLGVTPARVRGFMAGQGLKRKRGRKKK